MSETNDEYARRHLDRYDLGMAAFEGGDFGDEVPPARTTLLADVLGSVFKEIEEAVPCVEWPVGDDGWGTFAFRPNTIVVVGGPTNVGKTPLILNLLWQAMHITPTLRVLIANNESMTRDLINRLIAMLTEIDLRHIRRRDRAYCSPDKLAAAHAALRSVADRLEFMEMPFTLEQVVQRAAFFRADVVCVDTLQKLRLDGYDGEAGDTVGRIMPMLRDLANKGPCVVAAASISREGVRHLKHRVGKTTYDELDAGVFLHNSEIESSCNDAYTLAVESGAKAAQRVDEDYQLIKMWLHHVKARDELKVNIPLSFDGRYQKFSLRAAEQVRGPTSVTALPQPNVQASQPYRSRAAAAKASIPKKKEDGDDHWLR
jgi:replicative DNA helicase